MSVLHGYLLQLKDNGVQNIFCESKALPKQTVSYCAVIYCLFMAGIFIRKIQVRKIYLPALICRRTSLPWDIEIFKMISTIIYLKD